MAVQPCSDYSGHPACQPPIIVRANSQDDEGLLDTLQRNETETPMQGLGTSNFRSDHKAFRNMVRGVWSRERALVVSCTLAERRPSTHLLRRGGKGRRRSQGCKKGGFALALLQLGYSVLISDVDAVMLSNPVTFFDMDPIVKLADVWVSTDSLSPSNDRCVASPRRKPRRLRTGRSRWDRIRHASVAAAAHTQAQSVNAHPPHVKRRETLVFVLASPGGCYLSPVSVQLPREGAGELHEEAAVVAVRSAHHGAER